ncbi:MAG: NUDIX hydrolase [Candidatus Falkowbacteria bacterium]
MQFTDANGIKIKLPKGRPILWRISGYALVMSKNKLLTEIPTWSPLFELPGGAIREKEQIKEGIIRECYEETGYKIKITDDLPFYFAEANFYHKPFKIFYHSIMVVFRASLISKKQNKAVINVYDGNEIKEVFWRKLSAFTKKNTHPIVYPAICKLR